MELADALYVMAYKHQKAAIKIAPPCWTKIESLEVPDKYYRDRLEFKQLLIEKIGAILCSAKTLENDLICQKRLLIDNPQFLTTKI